MSVNDEANKIITEPAWMLPSLRRIGLISTNILLSLFYLAFAFANAQSFIAEPRLSVFLINRPHGNDCGNFPDHQA